MLTHELEATHLRGNRYAVKPKDQLGTCGFYPNPWMVYYVNAKSPEQAIAKARSSAEKRKVRAIKQEA